MESGAELGLTSVTPLPTLLGTCSKCLIDYDRAQMFGFFARAKGHNYENTVYAGQGRKFGLNYIYVLE